MFCDDDVRDRHGDSMVREHLQIRMHGVIFVELHCKITKIVKSCKEIYMNILYEICEIRQYLCVNSIFATQFALGALSTR